MGFHRAGQHRAQIGRWDMAKRLTLCLQVIEDGDLLRPGGPGKLGRVHHPVEVGHGRDAVLHRTGGRIYVWPRQAGDGPVTGR